MMEITACLSDCSGRLESPGGAVSLGARVVGSRVEIDQLLEQNQNVGVPVSLDIRSDQRLCRAVPARVSCRAAAWGVKTSSSPVGIALVAALGDLRAVRGNEGRSHDHW